VFLFVVKHILPNGFGHVYFLPFIQFAQFIVPYLLLLCTIKLDGKNIQKLHGKSILRKIYTVPFWVIIPPDIKNPEMEIVISGFWARNGALKSPTNLF